MNALIRFLAALIVFTATSAIGAPNDPDFSRQWYLHNDGSQELLIDIDSYHTFRQKGVEGTDIGWLEAQAEIARLGPAPAIVAVIDSGIDPTHPDLAGRISPEGFNFLKDGPKDKPIFDDIGHGTHVSGLIAANTDNRIGISGVAPPSVQVLPLRVLSRNFRDFSFMGKLISDYAADAINYAVAHRASVINMSFGWPKLVDTQNARNAVKNAIEKGVLVVAAAGNDRKSEATYPCDYPGVLCVGSVTNTGRLTSFSNWGGITDVLAPGDGIISLYPLAVESSFLRIQGYERLSGTSQSAPLISGIAATLRSVFPKISLNELKARILVSASPLPKVDAALYGNANLKRAIDAKPQPVYLPDFKQAGSVTIDEANLTAHGEFQLLNLWTDANDVTVELLINGASAGSTHADTLRSGDRITIPWMHSFASFDESSELRVVMKVSDGSKISRAFSVSLPVVRSVDQIPDAPEMAAIRLPQANWIGSNLGHLFSRFTQVADYPSTPRLPAYFQMISTDNQGSTFQFFDPASSSPLKTVSVRGITVVGKVPPQVYRIDANGDGKLDWLIAGPARDQNQLYYQFYFADSELKPLWGSADLSTWRVAVDARFATMLARNYALPGSWIKLRPSDSAAQGFAPSLVPAFVDEGRLPDPDNYRALSELHFNSDAHLYYLAPKQNASPKAGALELEVRALDGKSFRDRLGNIRVIGSLPLSASEQAQGHLRILFAQNLSLEASPDSSIGVLDLRSLDDFSIMTGTDWNLLSANGSPVAVLNSQSRTGSSATIGFYDEARGGISWSSSDAMRVDSSEFAFKDINNPIERLIGAIDLGSKGRFWLLESFFDIVGFSQKSPGAPASMARLPIDRDSSFPGQSFSDFFSATVVGTDEDPLAGVYIDSTIVRGDRVAVAVYKSDGIIKPIRYSLQIPTNCVQMSPIHLDDSPSSFALPLFCQAADRSIRYRVVRAR